ncbi:MAG: hypothetical protein KatS3mg114_0869 [Planctomycetaceae bacterium]|nr:MAG: hypothetical protein KatS3mg114_0869 [Planctomycetaceae bacterium]
MGDRGWPRGAIQTVVRGTSFYFHPYHAHTGVCGSKSSAWGDGGEREKEEEKHVYFQSFPSKLPSPFVLLPSPAFTPRLATSFTSTVLFPPSSGIDQLVAAERTTGSGPVDREHVSLVDQRLHHALERHGIHLHPFQ